MAITENNYTANGSNDTFNLTFEYLEQSHIKASIDGVDTTAFTLPTATTLKFNSVPTAGAAIRIFRRTDVDDKYAEFYPGSAIRSSDLNKNFDQTLFVTQELQNNALVIDGSNTMVGDLDMGGYRVINLGTPIAGTNAATKDYVDASTGSSEIPGHTRWRKVATAGQTVFSGTGNDGGTLSYSPVREQVYLNGALQQRNVDYSAADGTSITFNVALQLNDIVDVVCVNNLVSGTVSDAANITYSGQFAGQQPRTVASKLSDVVSVKDFGAVGDGTTDDTAAIQAALDSGAKRVIFPAGTYLIGSGQGVVVKSNTAVSGYGATLKNTRAQNPSTNTAVGDALYCGLIVNMGSSNITIEGLTIEGPAPTSISQPNMAYNSIGINIRGLFDRWYIDGVDDTTTGTSKNITIRDCTIYGWHQSGIIADYVDNLLIESCYVHTCGRDGIRVYGCAFFDISRNRVHNITPGFSTEGTAPNNNSYGIAATRVYRSEAGDGTVNLYRRSQDGLICHNRVTQVPTWKALDTHGGERLTFSHNYVYGSYIGIGLAIGGDSLTTAYTPLKDITVSYNEIRQNQANVATYGNRSGITVYADAWDDNNRGLDITITGNTIDGYGVLNTKGGIEISNFRNVSITDNKIKNCWGSGISFSNDNENIYIAGNLIQDVVSSAGVCRGIQIQAGFTHDIFIESGQFYQTPGGTTLVAIYSTEVDSAGFTGLRVDANLDYKGNVTPISAPANLSTLSQNNMVPIAWANVDVSGGVATIRSSRGVASVAWSATGVVNITLMEAVPSTSLTCGVATTRQNADVVCASVPVSTTVYTVYTYLTGALSDKNFCWVLYGVRNT